MASERVDVHVRVIGSRAAVRDLVAVGAAARGLQASVTGSSRAMEQHGRRSFLMNQALFTMRRLVYGTSLAFVGLGAAAIYSGFQFNKTVERTTIAMDFLAKGTFNAGEETRELLKIARETAFLPQDVIEAGQQLIAFGFTAEETNRTLRATGDAIAALNLPQDTVHRITLALGQIRSKGRLMGEELRQLANANVLSFDALEKALGRNVFELGRVADANIPADVAIAAILTSMEARFGGASKRIRETTSGQMEILRGDLQAIFGGLQKNLYDSFGNTIRRITPITGQMFNMVLAGNGGLFAFVEIIDNATGGTYHLSTALETLTQFLRSVWTLAKMVWAAGKPLFQLFLLLAWVTLEWTSGFITLMDMGGIPMIWVIRLLIFYMLVQIATTKLTILWGKRQTIMMIIQGQWIVRLVKAYRAWAFAQAVNLTLTEMGWRRAFLHNGVLARLSRTIFTRVIPALTGQAALTWAALGPIALMVVAVIALAAAWGYLYYKYEQLRPLLELFVFLFSPLAGILFLINRYVYDLGDALGYVIGRLDALKGKVDWLEGLIPDWLGGGTSLLDIVGGGGAGSGGVIANPFKTTAPESLDMNQVMTGSLLTGMKIQPAPVNIDGRQVAEVVFQHQSDRMARR